MLQEAQTLPAADFENFLKLPSTGDTVYDAQAVFAEMQNNYSSWKVVVPVNVSGTIAYFASLWLQYRLNTQDQLMRAVDAMTAEYNPIDNYNMLEESADGRRYSKETDTVTPEGGTESTTFRYGIDSDAYGSPSDRVTVTPMDDAKTETTKEFENDQSMDFNGDTLTGYHDAAEHYLKRSGNIGVTTSAQMIQGEVELRKTDLLRDYIREFFRRYAYFVGGEDSDCPYL